MSEQTSTPITADATATAPELLARAADDYATAQNRRAQLSHEERVHGNEQEGAR